MILGELVTKSGEITLGSISCRGCLVNERNCARMNQLVLVCVSSWIELGLKALIAMSFTIVASVVKVHGNTHTRVSSNTHKLSSSERI